MKTVDLRRAFDAVTRIAAKRTTLPVLNCVRLESADGRMTVRASNLDSDLSAYAPCDETLGPVCVPAKPLSQLVAFANEDVRLSVDGGRLTFESGCRAELPIIDAEEFPKFPEGEFKTLAINADDFSEALGAVVWAAGIGNLEKPERECVHVRTNGALICQATNGAQWSRFQSECICEETEFLIPQCPPELAAALRAENPIIEVSENHIRIRHDGGVAIVRLSDLKYPNTDPVLNGIVRIGEVSKEEFKRLVATVMPVYNSEKMQFYGAQFAFSKKALTVSYESDLGKVSASIDGRFAEGKMKLNPKLCLQNVDGINADSFEIWCGAGWMGMFLKTPRQIVGLAGLKPE